MKHNSLFKIVKTFFVNKNDKIKPNNPVILIPVILNGYGNDFNTHLDSLLYVFAKYNRFSKPRIPIPLF